MPGGGPASETFILKFRRREHRMHKRHEHGFKEPWIVTAIEAGLSPVVAESVKHL